MKTLISMTAYVKEQDKKPVLGLIYSVYNKIVNYTNFLSLTPEIWQFIPSKLVDGVWVVLEEPKDFEKLLLDVRLGVFDGIDSVVREALEYQTAKERCYFEGFELDRNKSSKDNIWITNKDRLIIFNKGKIQMIANEKPTLEDLIPYNLTLTATALKEIGL